MAAEHYVLAAIFMKKRSHVTIYKNLETTQDNYRENAYKWCK